MQSQIETTSAPIVSAQRFFEPLFLEQLLDSAFAFSEREVNHILQTQTWNTYGNCEIGTIKSPNNEFEIVKLRAKTSTSNLTQISYKDNDGLVYLVTISEGDQHVIGIEISGKRASHVAIGISAAFVTGNLKKIDIEDMIERSFYEQDNSLPIYKSIKPSL